MLWVVIFGGLFNVWWVYFFGYWDEFMYISYKCWCRRKIVGVIRCYIVGFDRKLL